MESLELLQEAGVEVAGELGDVGLVTSQDFLKNLEHGGGGDVGARRRGALQNPQGFTPKAYSGNYRGVVRDCGRISPRNGRGETRPVIQKRGTAIGVRLEGTSCRRGAGSNDPIQTRGKKPGGTTGGSRWGGWGRMGLSGEVIKYRAVDGQEKGEGAYKDVLGQGNRWLHDATLNSRRRRRQLAR